MQPHGTSPSRIPGCADVCTGTHPTKSPSYSVIMRACEHVRVAPPTSDHLRQRSGLVRPHRAEPPPVQALPGAGSAAVQRHTTGAVQTHLPEWCVAGGDGDGGPRQHVPRYCIGVRMATAWGPGPKWCFRTCRKHIRHPNPHTPTQAAPSHRRSNAGPLLGPHPPALRHQVCKPGRRAAAVAGATAVGRGRRRRQRRRQRRPDGGVRVHAPPAARWGPGCNVNAALPLGVRV